MVCFCTIVTTLFIFAVFHGCNYVFCYVFCVLYFNAVTKGFIRCMFQCYNDVLRLCFTGVATWFSACFSCNDVFVLCASVL